MYATDLWNQVHRCFDADDGSLPSIAIESLSPSDLSLIYETLTRDGRVSSVDPVFHDKQSDSMLLLNSVANAAKLVAEYKASPFHLTFSGISSNNRELPELGVFFFQDSISIDYRMGAVWDSALVFAYFAWLKHIVRMTESGKLAACTSDGPPYPEEFDRAWHAFLTLDN